MWKKIYEIEKKKYIFLRKCICRITVKYQVNILKLTRNLYSR